MVLEQAPARLAARAVVDRVLLEVDSRDWRSALRARLAHMLVDAVDGCVALALLAELERARQILVHRGGEAFDLLAPRAPSTP